MNDLEKYFNQNRGGLITKWNHYFDIYDHHFNRFRGKEVNVLEFGVYQGGSLEMWKNYFGENSMIIGVDINKDCKKFENKEKNIHVIIGNQSDKNFWDEFFSKAQMGVTEVRWVEYFW